MAWAVGSQPAATGADARRLEAGRVGRPHGLDGSFYVTRAIPRLLELGMPVTVAGRTVAIVRRAGTDRRPIVRVEGVGGREAAEALRGQALLVAQAAAPALEPGVYWAHELEGCSVYDGAHRVGVVNRLLQLPSCEALEVAREGAGVLLVPMVSDAVRDIDLPGRRIKIDLRFLGEAPPGRPTAADDSAAAS